MKFQKGFTPIFLLILLVAVLAGGYWIVQKQGLLLKKPSPSPSTKNETTNFKTYINKKYSFSLNVPPNLSILKKTDDFLLIFGESTINSIQVDFNSEFKPSRDYKLCSQIPSGQKSTSCIAEGKRYGQGSDIEAITLDGKAAKSFYLGGGVDYAYHVIQVENPKLEIKTSVAGGGLDQIFKNLLSTFKFTDQADETASWQMFLSNEYKYTLRYPSQVKHEQTVGMTQYNKTHDYFKVDGGTLEIYGVCGRGVQPVKTQGIIIAGQKTTKLYETNTSGVITAVSRPNSNESLCFNFHLPNDFVKAQSTDKLFDQILSTLQFVK